jgi:hypothetical protein
VDSHIEATGNCFSELYLSILLNSSATLQSPPSLVLTRILLLGIAFLNHIYFLQILKTLYYNRLLYFLIFMQRIDSLLKWRQSVHVAANLSLLVPWKREAADYRISAQKGQEG